MLNSNSKTAWRAVPSTMMKSPRYCLPGRGGELRYKTGSNRVATGYSNIAFQANAGRFIC